MDAICDGLWEYRYEVRIGPCILPCRTTVVRRSSGGLLVCSPGPIDSGLGDALQALGPVEVLVAPNCFHHLHMAEAMTAFPEAAVWLAPGLGKKRQDLLGETVSEALGDAEISLLPVAGMPAFHEFVLLHRPSGTLVVTDLVFNLVDTQLNWPMRMVSRLFGTYQRFAVSRLFLSKVSDRAAFTGSVDRILGEEFDRLVMAHGRIIATGGRERLRDALKGDG